MSTRSIVHSPTGFFPSQEHTMQISRAIAHPARLILLVALTASIGCATQKPITQSTRDAAITTRVANKMRKSGEVRKRGIDVDTQLQRVALRGEVRTEREREAAERIAMQTKGVHGVDNQLQVVGDVPDNERSDLWISTRVNTRLFFNPAVRAGNIDVDTVNGVVYLSGVVRNEEQRNIAESTALSMPGVWTVVNDLQLEQEAFYLPEAREPEERAPDPEDAT
jgi:hyperosmotically inducible periplasmic protein